jgi:hypothetical protein
MTGLVENGPSARSIKAGGAPGLAPFTGRAEPTELVQSFADAPPIVPIDDLWWPVPITV